MSDMMCVSCIKGLQGFNGMSVVVFIVVGKLFEQTQSFVCNKILIYTSAHSVSSDTRAVF